MADETTTATTGAAPTNTTDSVLDNLFDSIQGKQAPVKPGVPNWMAQLEDPDFDPFSTPVVEEALETEVGVEVGAEGTSEPEATPVAALAPTAEQIAALQRQQADATAQQQQEMLAQLDAFYKIPDEHKEIIPEGMAPVLEGYLKNTHLAVMSQVNALGQQLVNQILPQLIDARITQSTTGRKAETDFFTLYPHLNKPEYQQSILHVADAITKASPRLTQREKMLKIGAAAAAVNGLDPRPVTGRNNTPLADNSATLGRAPVQPSRARGASPVNRAQGANNQPKSDLDDLFDLGTSFRNRR